MWYCLLRMSKLAELSVFWQEINCAWFPRWDHLSSNFPAAFSWIYFITLCVHNCMFVERVKNSWLRWCIFSVRASGYWVFPSSRESSAWWQSYASSLSDFGKRARPAVDPLCHLRNGVRVHFLSYRRLRSDVEPLASKDYLQSFFSLQGTFKIAVFIGLTTISLLALTKWIANFSLSFQFFLLNFPLI